jgi:hypothetical protein
MVQRGSFLCRVSRLRVCIPWCYVALPVVSYVKTTSVHSMLLCGSSCCVVSRLRVCIPGCFVALYVALGDSSCRVVCLDYECAFYGAPWIFILCCV